MTLYGAAKAPGDPLREAGTTVVALTDSSTGTASETLAAATNIAAVTDNSGGSAGGDIKDIPDGGSGVSGGGWSSSGVRDTAITVINDNFKDLITANIAQKALNTVLTNAVASLAKKVSDLITHMDDGR